MTEKPTPDGICKECEYRRQRSCYFRYWTGGRSGPCAIFRLNSCPWTERPAPTCLTCSRACLGVRNLKGIEMRNDDLSFFEHVAGKCKSYRAVYRAGKAAG